MMTLGALRTTIGLILRELRLGERSCTRTEAFADSVVVTFYAPNLTREDASLIEDHFRTLANRHEWIPPKALINPKANSISVHFQNKVKIGGKMPL